MFNKLLHKEIDWEDRRFKSAVEFMKVIYDENSRKESVYRSSSQTMAKRAIELADVFINEYKTNGK